MNGGGLCAVCGAKQGPYDPAIGLPRCKGELRHPMYYHVPVETRVTRISRTSAVGVCDNCGSTGAHYCTGEYPTADRPVSKRNPSWTF